MDKKNLERYFVPLRIYTSFHIEETTTVQILSLGKHLQEKGYGEFGLIFSEKDFGRVDACQKLKSSFSRGYCYQLNLDKGRVEFYVYPLKDQDWVIVEEIFKGKIEEVLINPLLIKVIPVKDDPDYIDFWESKERNNFFWGLEIDFAKISSNLLNSLTDPLVAFPKICYLEDYPSFDALSCVKGNDKYFNPSRKRAEENLLLLERIDYFKIYRSFPDSILNTAAIYARSNHFEKGRKPQLDFFPINMTKAFIKAAFEGLRFRNKVDDTHLRRLVNEIRVVISKSFENYFMVIREIASFCKEKKIIIGPRGSAAGALISYCFEITPFDPLEYGLLFERFLNKDRQDLPDYDLDFPSNRRIEVLEWLGERFKTSHSLMHILTFSKLQVKNVIRYLGKVLGMSEFEIESIVKRIPFISIKKTILGEILLESEELQRLVKNEEKVRLLFEMSPFLEGLIINSGIHAAGVVLIPKIEERLSKSHLNEDTGLLIANRNMYELEYLGYVKLDILGIDSLGVMDSILKNQNLELQEIPLDDRETFESFKTNSTLGIFQITYVNSEIIKIIEVKNISDMADVIGLNRPGSMEYIPDFIDRKIQAKKGEIHFPLPGNIESLAPIINSTMNIFIWQEQIMFMVQQVADYTGSEADSLRKIIGKKLFDKMLEEERNFIKRCSLKLGEERAKILWNIVKDFKGYGFNKSHGISYALISYYTAYLKYHYPLDYYCSWCNFEKDPIKLSRYIQACASEGFEIIPPNLNLSEEELFSIQNQKLVVPLKTVFPSHIAREVVENRLKEGRNFDDLNDFRSRLPLIKEIFLKKGGFDKNIHFEKGDLKNSLRLFNFYWLDLDFPIYKKIRLIDLVYNHYLLDSKQIIMPLRVLSIKNFRSAMPRDNKRIHHEKGSLILSVSDGSFLLQLTVTKEEVVNFLKKYNPVGEIINLKIRWRKSVKDFVVEAVS